MSSDSGRQIHAHTGSPDGGCASSLLIRATDFSLVTEGYALLVLMPLLVLYSCTLLIFQDPFLTSEPFEKTFSFATGDVFETITTHVKD